MTKNDPSASGNGAPATPKRVSPSQFMRWLRPEYYSDTEDQVSYVLDAPILEHHLETITQRNQTHDFEIFCRKLCERTISPNLRPQTGPEGGGDGKVDSETYPVSDEIAALTYVGEANGGRERWAFAFSAKKEWSQKVRDDVKGIVETGRKYDKIICVTSRPARSKDRARIEQELSTEHGIPITIHDRSWIVKEIIENDRKDIAFNYLKVGEVKNDSLRLGPTDYSRSRQLTEIEKSIDDPATFEGMEGQRVAEALIAAKLSRNMERPRTETDGRFLRAIRLADADGTDRQKLEAKYEHIWTAFWWFDDFKFLNDSYAAFETLALRSENVKNLDFLCNLLQILFNSVIHKHLSREECLLDQRIANLRRALEPMAADNNRPNNSLDAQTSLLIIRLSEAALDKNDAEMADIWVGFSNILEKASGLGEFDAKRLVRMVEIAGDVAGADPVYNDLIEKTAKFVADRTSEAEGALILLKRAQKLDFSSNFDMIRLLGRATIGLAKKEYADQLIESVQLLMLAYRSAGLLWAARASCVFLAASLVMEGEEDSQLPASFVPTMKIWAWIALELRHIPDFIFAIQMLNGALASLPLAEDSKKRVKKDLFELDAALGSLFLNLNEAELRKLENLPDILEGLGLFMARTALLYNLGYSELLRSDGSFPSAESDEDINRLLSTLASQPVAQALRGPLILNADGQQVLSTAIIGMTVEITLQGNLESILVAEEVLGSLEAFFATAIEQRIIPHTEKLRITVHETDTASQPTFEINKLDMTAILTWPMGVSPTSYEQQAEMQRFFMEVAGHVLATTCVLNNADGFLQKLYVDEAVHHRMLMVALAPNSYQRVTSRSLSRITDWQNTGQKSYSLSSARPKLTIVRLTNTEEVAAEDDAIGQSTEFPDMKDHRALSVRSVIDVHAWDLARWKGTGYVQFDHASPPCMAFLFENEEGARSIFGRWRERFGDQDQNEEILVSIIRQLPQQNKHHYCVQVTSKLPASAEIDPKKILMMASRSLVMEPQSDTNLEQFLTSYQQSGMFSLMPAILKSGSPPKFLPELAILKRNLSVKLAANVAENDPEAVALRIRREA